MLVRSCVPQESSVDIPAELRTQFIDLHNILKALRSQNIKPALEFVCFMTLRNLWLKCTAYRWVQRNSEFLQSRSSPLEFHLHRSQYIRLLLSSHPPNIEAAKSYANTTLRPFYDKHPDEFKRLMTCIVYLPLSKLQRSPYADLASPSLHFDLEPLFAKEYCASLGMSRQVPLRVVGDIGGGGSLGKIEKGRRLMRERKGEWSQRDELPVC